MAAPFVAWSIVLLPLGAALGLALAPLRGLAARRVSTAAAAGLLLLAGLACLAAPHGREFSWGLAPPWLATTGSGLSLAVDGLNRYALLALAAVLLLAVCVEGRFGGTPSRARLALALTGAGGMALVLTSRDLMVAAAGHGLAGLALAAVLGLGRAAGSGRAGRRFAHWAASGSLMLAGAAALGGAGSGSTLVDELAAAGVSHGGPAAALAAAALAMQIPLVPFHTWLVPVCTSGALSGRILISGAWCAVGAFGLLRFWLALFPAEALAASPWLGLWAGASALWTAMLAVVQPRPGLSRRAALAVASTGALMAAGVFAPGSLQALGAAALAAGIALPRASLLLLALWIEDRGAGGLRTAWAWLALGLTVAAAPGGGALPGWLTLMAGVLAAHPVLGWLLILSSGVLALALLDPVVGLARRPPSSGRGALGWVLALVIATAGVVGLRPEPLLSGARPVIERMVAGSPTSTGPAEGLRP